MLDLLLAGSLLYVGIWVYELANLASLTLFGFHANLALSGFFPAGVSGVSAIQGDLVLVKPLQIVISVGTVLPLLFLLRGFNLPVAKFTILGTVSTYCATAFWEALSFSWIAATLAGQATFAGLNVVTMLLLMLAFDKAARLGSTIEDSSRSPPGVLPLFGGSSTGGRHYNPSSTLTGGDQGQLLPASELT